MDLTEILDQAKKEVTINLMSVGFLADIFDESETPEEFYEKAKPEIFLNDYSQLMEFSEKAFEILRTQPVPASKLAEELDLESRSDFRLFEHLIETYDNGQPKDVWFLYNRLFDKDKERFIWYLHNEKNLEMLRWLASKQI